MTSKRKGWTRIMWWCAKVRIPEDPNGCWQWIGGHNSRGYGAFSDKGKRHVGAHRYGYERFVGPVPLGLELDHLCRNRSCVNPEHLEPVTSRVNLLRGVGLSAKYVVRTHCSRGHEYTDENTNTKFGYRICRTCQRHRRQQRTERDRARRKACA